MASTTFVGASSDLVALFEKHNVDTNVGKGLIAAGVTDVATFGAIVETTADLREMLKSDFELDGATGGIMVKGKIAKFMVAWEVAKSRTSKRA